MDLNTFFIASSQNYGPKEFAGGLIVYIYFAYTTMVLARRLTIAKPWLAWVPVANLYLITKMAGKEWWWIFGFIIPVVNFFVAAYLWSEIGERLGKPWWMGALVIIPIVGWLVPGYFVLSTGHSNTPPAQNVS